MTALEAALRSALRRYDPPQPPAPAAMAHRPLGAYEGTLPKWLPEPHGPDEVVFGPERDEREPPEPWGITGTCRTHAVEWGGYGQRCWCCADGVKPL